jgi:hypothetical protein
MDILKAELAKRKAQEDPSARPGKYMRKGDIERIKEDEERKAREDKERRKLEEEEEERLAKVCVPFFRAGSVLAGSAVATGLLVALLGDHTLR